MTIKSICSKIFQVLQKLLPLPSTVTYGSDLASKPVNYIIWELNDASKFGKISNICDLTTCYKNF